MLKVEQAELKGVIVVHLDCFEDHRGEYVETYNERIAGLYEWRDPGITKIPITVPE